jgi:hypothetical protein
MGNCIFDILYCVCIGSFGVSEVLDDVSRGLKRDG